jgi:hypothetical protein
MYYNMIIMNAITYKIVVRDESGAETFQLSRGKMKIEWKYENGNGVLQNENGTFLAETKTKNGATLSGRIGAETEFLFSANMEFPI